MTVFDLLLFWREFHIEKMRGGTPCKTIEEILVGIIPPCPYCLSLEAKKPLADLVEAKKIVPVTPTIGRIN